MIFHDLQEGFIDVVWLSGLFTSLHVHFSDHGCRGYLEEVMSEACEVVSLLLD